MLNIFLWLYFVFATLDTLLLKPTSKFNQEESDLYRGCPLFVQRRRLRWLRSWAAVPLSAGNLEQWLGAWVYLSFKALSKNKVPQISSNNIFKSHCWSGISYWTSLNIHFDPFWSFWCIYHIIIYHDPDCPLWQTPPPCAQGDSSPGWGGWACHLCAFWGGLREEKWWRLRMGWPWEVGKCWVG